MADVIEFKREIHYEPSGQGHVTVRWLLQGPKGIIQFCYEMIASPQNQDHYLLHYQLMGSDVGYHAYVPLYEGQSPMEACPFLGCDCYYDGSSLAGSEMLHKLLTCGHEAVWHALELRYMNTLNDNILPAH